MPSSPSRRRALPRLRLAPPPRLRALRLRRQQPPATASARGFSSIADAEAFAGGEFSFFNREGIRLTGTGVALTAPDSFLPDLRSSKDEGQSNFNNPGLQLYNAGARRQTAAHAQAHRQRLDASLQFARTQPLIFLLQQNGIRRTIGTDASLGAPSIAPSCRTTSPSPAALPPSSPARASADIYTAQTLFSPSSPPSASSVSKQSGTLILYATKSCPHPSRVPILAMMLRKNVQRALQCLAIVPLGVALFSASHRSREAEPRSSTQTPTIHHSRMLRFGEAPEEAANASAGCISCHTGIEHPNMHAEDTVVLGCADCHGGNASITSTSAKGSAEYTAAERRAHVQPRLAENAANGGHPVRAYTHWIEESTEFVRFVNPGDLRVAPQTCGACHAQETLQRPFQHDDHWRHASGARPSTTTAPSLSKNPHFGESYDADGKPERLRNLSPPTPEETRTKGVLPYLDPLQRWEISEPGNMLRVFERGGEKRGEIGNPNTEESAGQPDLKLSVRGLGTGPCAPTPSSSACRRPVS